MIKLELICLLCSTVLSLVLGCIFIAVSKRIKVGQPIYKYVETHKEKNGTPTMGGLFFILSAVVTFLIFSKGDNRLSTVAMIIGLAYMLVGFLDDFIKIKSKDNQGLKPYQKIIFQLSIAVVSGLFSFYNGLNNFYLPFTKMRVNLGVFTIIFVGFIFIAITNSVNLTDGLDGLAGGVSRIYLIAISIIIYLQNFVWRVGAKNNAESQNLITLCVCLIGALTGFLTYNTNKASVFMGDTGSLSLGGFIGAISIFSGNSFFIPVLGIMFVISSISVIMQVLYYKKTKKRVFLMAPYHHHLQMKGLRESKISYLYSFITMIVGVVCIIGCL